MRVDANLYIPIELKNREFFSKVLLAKYAAQRGFRVFLGRKSELSALALRMPPGVYHGLGTVENLSGLYQSLVDRGNRVTVIDEEGLITFSDEMYLDLKVSPRTLAIIDRLFAWGAEHRRVLADGRPATAHKLRISGSPRFDLLKPAFRGVYDSEIAELRRRHRRFVLICMSFGNCNHYIRGLDYVQSLIEKKVLRTPRDIAAYRRYLANKMNAWLEFLRAIPLLATAYPEVDFVIRPHPSESSDPYRELGAAHANVFTSDDFSIHPWVLTAEAVVHHYCTSSVEAFAAGTPGFALRPEPDPQVEKEIAYQCSRQCGSAEALVEALRPVCATHRGAKLPLVVPERSYSDYVLNIGDAVSTEVIAAELATLASEGELHGGKTYRAARPRGVWRSRARGLLAELNSRNGSSRRYISHKIGSMNAHEVRQVLQKLVPHEAMQFRCESAGHMIVSIEHECPG
jgi:surface carbohydrate biosynthesis protein